MDVFQTSAGRIALERIFALGLAGKATAGSFRRMEDAIPVCLGIVFELVLGDGHPGEADLAVRLAPASTEEALKALGGHAAVQDCRELAAMDADHTWIELDTSKDSLLPSVSYLLPSSSCLSNRS